MRACEKRQWQTALMVLLAGLLAGGCATMYRARKAQRSEPPPGERTVTATEAGLSAGSTLTLDRAVAIALAYHPAMVQAQQGLVSAKKQTAIAASGYVPVIQGQG